MTRYILMLALVAIAFTTKAQVPVSVTNEPDANRVIVLPEGDTYIDLVTGKQFRLHWDATTNTYVREDMQPLEFYVSTVSTDTFWGPQARPANNAIIRERTGRYAIDQYKIKENESSLKMKGPDGSKIKANENELKWKEGEDKVKANENEVKEKIGDAKMKDNGREKKEKNAYSKYKYNGKEEKYKEEDGTKVKSNDKETKVKTKDTKTIFNHKTGEVKTKDR